MAERTTIDVWYIFVDYGDGMPNKPEDAECTETGYYQFLVNKLAYQENCQYPINTRKGRQKKSDWPGGWDAKAEKRNRLLEAKAEVDYRKTLIRLRGDSEKRQRLLARAEEKLARIQS
jgi:hypothetical protein